MSQTILLDQTTTSQSSITLKLNNNHSSNENPSPTIDSTEIINDTVSTSDPEDQSFDNHASDDHAIRIHNVDSETLAAVNDFLRRNGSSDEEVRTAAMNDLRNFIEREEIGTETLLVLVKFAYDANNAELLDVFCQRVADVIKDKTVEEVREIFNITNDFTPEEEQEVRDEHPWAFES